MSDLTIFPADIAEMSVSQLAALPAAQKHEIDKNLEAAIDWLKKARTKFDAALDQCYGEQARDALRESGRDFGTAHISDGVLRIKFELPKKTSWNQDMARELAARIVASGAAAAVRCSTHCGFRQAVFHPFPRFGVITMSSNLIASLRQQLPSIYGEHLPDEIRYRRADGQYVVVQLDVATVDELAFAIQTANAESLALGRRRTALEELHTEVRKRAARGVDRIADVSWEG